MVKRYTKNGMYKTHKNIQIYLYILTKNINNHHKIYCVY